MSAYLQHWQPTWDLRFAPYFFWFLYSLQPWIIVPSKRKIAASQILHKAIKKHTSEKSLWFLRNICCGECARKMAKFQQFLFEKALNTGILLALPHSLCMCLSLDCKWLPGSCLPSPMSFLTPSLIFRSVVLWDFNSTWNALIFWIIAKDD